MTLVMAAAWLTVGSATLYAQAPAAPGNFQVREEHEGLTIAADPYVDASRSKERFGKKHPQASGILAVELQFRNNNDYPIRLTVDSIRLVIEPPERRRQRLEPLTVEDVLAVMLNKGGAKPPSAPRTRLPIPIPRADRGKEWDKMDAVLRPMTLELGLLPPKATMRGFVYFDLNYNFDLVAHSHVYVPDLTQFGGKPLMFFELDLGRAAARP